MPAAKEGEVRSTSPGAGPLACCAASSGSPARRNGFQSGRRPCFRASRTALCHGIIEQTTSERSGVRASVMEAGRIEAKGSAK